MTTEPNQTAAAEVELLPCPLEHPIKNGVRLTDYREDRQSCRYLRFWIECGDCGLEIEGPPTHYKAALPEFISKWNTRAPSRRWMGETFMTITNQPPGEQRHDGELDVDAATGCADDGSELSKALAQMLPDELDSLLVRELDCGHRCTFTAPAGETTLALAINTADLLTDAERVELFSRYCQECGTKDLPCHCWNDE